MPPTRPPLEVYREAPDSRRAVLNLLKGKGAKGIADVAKVIGLSYEGARQVLALLESEGWVERHFEHPAGPKGGRPRGLYNLTIAGDHLFPKAYEALAIEMIDVLGLELGEQAVRDVLTAMTDRRVQQWAGRLDGKSLRERIMLLKDLYLSDDPHTEIEEGPDGMRIVERNCPFLHIALKRPAVCSTTMSFLTRLLGVRVTRELKFQDGDGCCAFRVHTDKPVEVENFHFAFEDNL